MTDTPATPDSQPTREADIDPDPSPEAVKAVTKQLERFQYLFGYHVNKHPVLVRFLAQEFDRFAAQHSTAAPVSGDRTDDYCTNRIHELCQDGTIPEWAAELIEEAHRYALTAERAALSGG